MTFVLTHPQMMATAATDVAGIGSAIYEVNVAAVSRTTTVLAAGADEVSVAVATLFNTYAHEYQALLRQALVFHGEFAQALTVVGNAYAQADAANVVALTGLSGGTITGTAVAPAAADAPPFSFPTDYHSVFISGSGVPAPSSAYMTTVFKNYIQPSFRGGLLANALGLFTPAGLYPLTGTTVLSLNESVAQGVSILHDTLVGTGAGQHGLIYPGGKPVVVQGISQGAMIASLEMHKLAAMPNPPTAQQLGFVLLGNPMNPNGGLFSRFAGLTLPSLGQTFFGATPSNTPWPTAIYTLEYDGIADWPQYPINILADLNAFAGFYYVHGLYPGLDPGALPPGYSLVELPTSPGYTGNTTYYMINVPHLPLLEPVRSIPLIGNLVADLVEPDLKVLVNLGYGDPAHGYSTGPADVPTPFGLFPSVDPQTLVAHLAIGTQQGVNAAGADLDVLGGQGAAALSSLVSNPLSALSVVPTPSGWIDNSIAALRAENTYITNDFTSVVTNASAKVQPTVDIAIALLISMPSYELSLFLDGMVHMADGGPVEGLINAVGMPIAAAAGLTTLLGGYELLVLTGVWYPPPTPL